MSHWNKSEILWLADYKHDSNYKYSRYIKINNLLQLSKYALERATEMAKKDEMIKRPNNDYGENVSCLWSSDPNHMVDDDDIAKRWYKEHEGYDYGKEPTVLSAG